MCTQQLFNALGLFPKIIPKIYAGLKVLNEFNRELYKDNVRALVVNSMNTGEANSANIKKRLAVADKNMPFFPELVEEILKEDYQADEGARKKVFKILAAVEEKKKAEKPVNFKPTLIEGLNALGSTVGSFSECLTKLSENNEVFQNQKRGLWDKIKQALAQMANKEPEPVVYFVEYIDPIKGTKVNEKVNFNTFSGDLEKKIKILGAIAAKGTAASKLEKMEEPQLIELLQRNVRDVQTFHKTLTALDEMFKAEAPKEDRAKIKGIKPELGAIKNAITVGNQKYHDYNNQKEEQEQFKKLGIAAN
jgi:hypothetical protein